MAFLSAFFAFPNQPEELKAPILAAVDLANKQADVRVKAWPQLPIFGASIPDTVKEAIEKTDVLVCDITRPNLNVYYEIGYCIGLARSVAPVINVSFANASSDIQKDGLFDIIGYGAYTNSAELASLLTTLPTTVLLDLTLGVRRRDYLPAPLAGRARGTSKISAHEYIRPFGDKYY